jgi:hypothetical protein
MKTIFSCLVLVIAFVGAAMTVFAQRETENGIQVEQDLALVRRDLRSEKKKILAMNLPLSEAEATKFWPVYDQMTGEMAKNNDEFYCLIKDFVANQKTITDAQASAMIKRWGEIQVVQAKTRQKYIPLIEQTIPAKKAALFFQIDRRLWALLDLQVASAMPLVAQ